jgi:hypothetical protein
MRKPKPIDVRDHLTALKPFWFHLELLRRLFRDFPGLTHADIRQRTYDGMFNALTGSGWDVSGGLTYAGRSLTRAPE